MTSTLVIIVWTHTYYTITPQQSAYSSLACTQLMLTQSLDSDCTSSCCCCSSYIHRKNHPWASGLSSTIWGKVRDCSVTSGNVPESTRVWWCHHSRLWEAVGGWLVLCVCSPIANARYSNYDFKNDFVEYVSIIFIYSCVLYCRTVYVFGGCLHLWVGGGGGVYIKKEQQFYLYTGWFTVSTGIVFCS
jgi:hypothetical protein